MEDEVIKKSVCIKHGRSPIRLGCYWKRSSWWSSDDEDDDVVVVDDDNVNWYIDFDDNCSFVIILVQYLSSFMKTQRNFVTGCSCFLRKTMRKWRYRFHEETFVLIDILLDSKTAAPNKQKYENKPSKAKIMFSAEWKIWSRYIKF